VSWLDADHYWLARLAFQRALALVYLIAYLTSANQFRALLGSRGLLPIPQYVRRVSFRAKPSVFVLHYSDRFFAVVAWSGAGLSACLLAGLGDGLPLPVHMLLWALLWAGYVSIVNVGQLWYGFGWESLLCEVGFVAIFLGPADVPPPWPMLIALRWVLFRLEFGAGLIKLRGDGCWRDLTCLYYHHETQPMPNPLSWYFHHLPRPLHKVEVAANHVTQLIVPVLLFTPAPVADVAALVVIVTQLWLMVSGNFSWLNATAIVLALSVIHDGVWHRVLGISADTPHGSPRWFGVLVLVVAALILVLSYWPARNLVSRRQVMNTAFDPQHLVNAYGAFGSITRVRREIVIEGTSELEPGPDAKWLEYQFKGKPGDVRRRPAQVAPYHLRLDWLMWFAALSPAYGRSWFVPFLGRLLAGDRATLKLLRHNPFPDEPPVWVRAHYYRYRFTTRAERRASGAWWERTYVREYVPAVRRDELTLV
jgi:hypothetical protein